MIIYGQTRHNGLQCSSYWQYFQTTNRPVEDTYLRENFYKYSTTDESKHVRKNASFQELLRATRKDPSIDRHALCYFIDPQVDLISLSELSAIHYCKYKLSQYFNFENVGPNTLFPPNILGQLTPPITRWRSVVCMRWTFSAAFWQSCLFHWKTNLKALYRVAPLPRTSPTSDVVRSFALLIKRTARQNLQG
jgi:hypothetical protein